MVNLQLIDSLEGGDFIFKRNDYILDEGIYSELYACLFGTGSAEWLFDSAFDVQSEKIASKTENALKTHNSNSESDISLIKKAVLSDLSRFKTKNPQIEVVDVALVVYNSGAIMILIKISGFSDAFNFIYTKTKQSLDNIAYKVY